MSINVEIYKNKLSGKLQNKSGAALSQKEIIIMALELEFKTALQNLTDSDLNLAGSGYSGLTRNFNKLFQNMNSSSKNSFRCVARGDSVNAVFDALYQILEIQPIDDFIPINQDLIAGF